MSRLGAEDDAGGRAADEQRQQQLGKQKWRQVVCRERTVHADGEFHRLVARGAVIDRAVHEAVQLLPALFEGAHKGAYRVEVVRIQQRTLN